MPRQPRGRPPGKPCATQGCKNKAVRDNRFCGWCGGKILHALREDRSYWKYDQRPTEGGNGGAATMSLD